jgi:hypothetical protein
VPPASSTHGPCLGAGCDNPSHELRTVRGAWTVGEGATVVIDPKPFAEAIVRRLGASVIPSSFPAHIGELLRETARFGSYQYVHMLPGGAHSLSVQYVINPDGTLNMEFQEPNGSPFWRGTFRPEASHADS